MIVERLARRCGFDAVAAALPPGDHKLLSHIRKEALRKQRTRAASAAGSQVGGRLGGCTPECSTYAGRENPHISSLCSLRSYLPG